MLQFSEEKRGDVVVLILEGRLDALTANELRPTIDRLVEKQALKVVCHLRKLEMIDSSGVGAIVSLFKRLRKLGGDVYIAEIAGQPKEIFRLLRLDRAFDIFDKLDLAVAKFN